MSRSPDTLFPSEPLLLNRFGNEIFNSVPPAPGIYRFFDKQGALLYVGKSKNLRSRISSYKCARAGRVSKKVGRLISQIAHLEIEVTDTEYEAILLENHWIREERPPYNHANKQTEAYYFVYLKPDTDGLEFRLSMRIHEETEKQYWYGCFKGHNPVRNSLGSMLQLLYMAERRCLSPHHLPVQLTRRLTPVRYTLPWSTPESPAIRDNVSQMLHDFITGKSCELLIWLVLQIDVGHHTPLTGFPVYFLENKLDTLKTFFDYKLVQHRYLREALPNERKIIGQNELDDLLIRVRR